MAAPSNLTAADCCVYDCVYPWALSGGLGGGLYCFINGTTVSGSQVAISDVQAVGNTAGWRRLVVPPKSFQVVAWSYSQLGRPRRLGSGQSMHGCGHYETGAGGGGLAVVLASTGRLDSPNITLSNLQATGNAVNGVVSGMVNWKAHSPLCHCGYTQCFVPRAVWLSVVMYSGQPVLGGGGALVSVSSVNEHMYSTVVSVSGSSINYNNASTFSMFLSRCVEASVLQHPKSS